MLLLASCATQSPLATASSCTPSATANRELVSRFDTQALVQKQVRPAFERYVTTDFIEHKPDIPGGTREGAIVFLEGLVAELPQAQWQIVRTVADRDMVALHARFRPAAGAPEYAIADFFRVENCRIVEHWDVVAPPSEAKGNPNSRF
jgi:predicted SnoaL-like aldol condensation-catalyzing enzyme